MFHKISGNKNFWIGDELGEGGSKRTLFQKFFSHGSGKLRTRNFLRFTKFLVSKDSMNRTGGRGGREERIFLSKVFVSQC